MSDGSMEYEYTLVNSPHHGSQPHSGPPGLRTSRCPYADASRVGRPDWSEVGGRFAESSAAYTPSWQSSSLSSQRWSPHNQPPVLRLEHPPSSHNFNAGLSSLGAYSNYTSPAPAPHPRPQTTNPPPSSTTAATTADSTQDGHQTPSTQVHVPATHVSLGTPRGMTPTSTAAPGSSTGAPTQSTTALTNLDQGDGSQTVNSTVVSSQPVSVRLPVPTGHSIYSRPQRHRLSSGRTALSEELLGEPSRTTTDGSGPSTSSSDDDSDLEIGPRLHFMGYQHSTRQSQILRGQMTNKRVASRKAIQSLQEVDMATLPEKEKTCVICYNDYGVASPEGAVETPLRLPKCKHVFGNQCIRKWLEESYSCPYCRDQLDSELAKPSEAAIRRMLSAAGEDMLLTHSTFRRMMQSYISRERDTSLGDRAQVSFRRRRDHDHGESTPSQRDGATRGERRALPEDHTDAQRRQRPRHDALHSSRSSIAPSGPSFISGNRHGSPMTTSSQMQSPVREHFSFSSWQPSQQASSSRRILPPQLPQPSPFPYNNNRSQQAQAPVSAPSSLTHLHMMGLSYPPSVTGPYNNQLPPVTSRQGGYPQTTFQPMSTSPPAPMYGYPSGFLNPMIPGRDLQYPSFSPLSPLTDPSSFPPHLPPPEQFHGNAYTGANQPPPSVTQPERNGGGQHTGLYSPPP